MRAFPSTEVALVSRLPPDEVVHALDALVAERQVMWPWNRITKPFEGHIRGRRFEIARASRLWRAGALPVVEGAIEPRDGGSVVRLRFRSTWTPAARALWIAALAIPALLAVRGMWTIGVPDPLLLLVVGVAAAGWWATKRRFDREVRTAIELLAPLGEPQPESGAGRARAMVREE